VFNKRLMTEMSVVEGKRLYLEVDVFGVPVPDVEWTLNGNPIPPAILQSDSPSRFSLTIPQGMHEMDLKF
jgi:hypothetical protein